MQLLPKPRSVQQSGGELTLPAELALSGPPEWTAAVRRLLAPGTGLALPDVDAPKATAGRLSVTPDPALPVEGYRLEVTPDGIAITAADLAGVNWATQTLRQLLPASVLLPAPTGADLTLPCVLIEDAPRFSWRGVHIDVARHFLPLRDLFGLVDLLALHKHNVLHLHLNDDQGWRFQSHRHPRLHEVGGWRTETRRPDAETGDGTPHGGYYRQDQLRALAAYAGQCGITVVPELDLPGHARAMLAAYPELGNHPERAVTTATTFGIFDEVLNMSEATLEVVLDVFDELLAVFPGPFVHVGGDECPTAEWRADPTALAQAAERGLAGPEHLQGWFTRRLAGWLADRGRRLVGWDEIADDLYSALGQAQDAGQVQDARPVVMAWRSARYGVAAVAAGMDVVMSPLSHTYFDYYASADPREPYAIGGLITTEHAYGLDPLDGVPPNQHARVIGTQCQVWTEYLPSAARVQYALFPRACAHSEVAWSDSSDRSWPEFAERLDAHLERLDTLGVNYRPETGPRPWQAGGSGSSRRHEPSSAGGGNTGP